MFWLGAIVSLCYIPGVTGAYIATQWPVLAIALSFGLWRSGPFTVFHAIGLLFLAYATVHMAWSPAPYASVWGLWLIWIMGLALWFGTTMTDMRGLYAGLALGASVSSMAAVGQHFGWTWYEAPGWRPAGLYANEVQQGTVLALIVIALMTERMWLWIPALIPGIVLAGSRGAWLALAIGLLGCYVRRMWVFGTVAVVGAFYLLTPLTASDEQRMQIWNGAWDGLTWFGWGPGIFYTVLMPQSNGGWFYPEHAHNDALQLAFEYGVGSVAPFVLFAFALCCTSARQWPIALAFTAASCYSMPLWMPIASFLALVCVGRILRDHALARDDGSDWGFVILPRPRFGGQASVSMASGYPTEG